MIHPSVNIVASYNILASDIVYIAETWFKPKHWTNPVTLKRS